MIKSYTTVEQSKKLAKILPLESADMYWLNKHTDLTETKYEVFVIDKSNKHIDFFNSYAVAIDNNEIIPCWSLAALLNVLPKGYSLGRRTNGKFYVCMTHIKHNISEFDNPVDALYNMIIKLHELNLL